MDWEQLLVQERFRHPDYVAKPNRPLFSQDADRIVFSTPFRRLANKTQVHPLYDHDHIHHRLIHSVETSLVGRSLGLNVGHWLESEKRISGEEQIDRFTLSGTIQAACLAHDIGNPPFGHSGEEAIGGWFEEYFETGIGPLAQVDDGVKNEFVKFEGNAQGFRIVTQLEMYKDNGGMQLSFPVLAAFQKYPARARTSKALGKDHYVGLKKFGVFENEWSLFQEIAERTGLISEHSDHGTWYRRHPLVFLVEAADDICYQILDLEDAFVAGDLSEATVTGLLKNISQANDDRGGRSIEEQVQLYRALAIGKAVDACVEAFKANYEAIMQGTFSNSLIEVSQVSDAFASIDQVAKRQIFTARRKTELEVSGRSIIRRVLSGVVPIYEDLAKNSWDEEKISAHHKQLQRALNLNFTQISSAAAALHSLADFVSGMTDRYAVKTSKIVSGLN